MNRLFLITAFLLLVSCGRDKGLTWFSNQKASEYFQHVKDICDRDDGALWGENLYGPVMYVDSRTRTLYANMPDREGLLKQKDGIYTGVLPKERLITNNIIEFGGVKYAMVPLPENEDSYRISARTVHSLFHAFQEFHKLKPSTFNTRHMNERNARLYLKLEWKALEDAIKSGGETRRLAIRDALIFRGARRELFPGTAADENMFENYEGLTTFTYITLCSDDSAEMRSRILEYLDRIYNNASYAAGYGFVHGALYATLLHDTGFDFRQVNTPDFDLGKAASVAYDVILPEVCRDVAGSIALNYDLSGIRNEETEREEKIKERTGKIITTFFEKPVVVLTMESPNFIFEPEDINNLDTLGTMYNRLRVSDNWGRLAVDDGGALLTNDLRTLRLSAHDVRVERNHLTGDGWHLILSDNWQVIQDEKGNYQIKKQMP